MSELTIKLPSTINHSATDIYNYTNVKISLPDRCPLCDEMQTPIFITSSGLEDGDYKFSIILECNKCRQHFLQHYKFNSASSSRMGIKTKYADQINFEYQFNNSDFNDEITSCSPGFVKIKHQLDVAEKMNLDELLKFGYRKAIEQLVWDYLKTYQEKSEKNLQSKSLPERIKLLNIPENNWISDLIAWVGNDGAHPYQRNQELTIIDMKNLSNLLVSQIQNLIQQHKYMEYHSKNK